MKTIHYIYLILLFASFFYINEDPYYKVSVADVKAEYYKE